MSENGNGHDQQLSAEQKQYLQGFTMGHDVARAVRGLPVLAGSQSSGTTVKIGATDVPRSTDPEAIHRDAQDRFIAAGRKLCNEEKAKREKNPFEMWDQMTEAAEANRFPKGTDVFLYKYHGLFHVAPAQDSFMCRLRFAGGVLKSYQLRGIADLSDRFAGGYSDVTTRANLQLREIPASAGPSLLTELQDLGVVVRGSGADNIRNVTASPLSGIDPAEIIETLPLARDMHHYILNHREMYGLPRKFNIAFDGAGSISSLEDTNDIGFSAVRVPVETATTDVPSGAYFQLTLGGITGHKDFARPTGVLVKPEECVSVAAAIVRVFIAHGDRTDRKKARLKYLLDSWGFDRFLQETEGELGRTLRRFPLDGLDIKRRELRQAHLGVHPQKQPGRCYVGVVLPVGRMTADQMRVLANLAEHYGSGMIRLTVWQNLIISDIREESVEAVCAAIEAAGLHTSATSIRSGLVACTGAAGCKFANAHTKQDAMALASYLEERHDLDQPINIHLTGCHHSCAQHYIGDIGLLATKVEVGDDMVEGYHVHVGGGYGHRQAIARQIVPSVPAMDVAPLLSQLLGEYLQRREEGELFADFTNRHSIEELQSMIGATA
jgi:ferredoxin-nitrite reductase